MDEAALTRQFRAYMQASERLLTTYAILDKLDVVAQALVESGLFQRCVVRVYRRRFSSRRVVGVAGVSLEERRLLLQGAEAPAERYLALTAGARHLGGDCYHVRENRSRPNDEGYAALRSRRDASEFVDWRPDDAFLAHLYSSRRVLLGHLAADDPPDGRVPDDESCRSFVLFASLAASLLEQELRLRTDPMTDAFNGACLDHELARLGSGQLPFTAVFADMDGLKGVNDSFGHQMGDHYIRAAHEILLAALPDDGLVYRPYGDEFVYVREGPEAGDIAAAVGTVPAAVRRWNARVRPGLAAVMPEAAGAGPLPPLRLSVGMAHGVEAEAATVVRRAEEAMYREKEAHRRGREGRPRLGA